ncbi:MAG: NAD(P)/FAD-dependent oxidoreductase [Acholeplasmatales bacterium]|nr:NAD(P)/FAD-dependent oxidoreductase [Acholeplasmatales bacterium]
MHDVIIIGTGAAGISAALTLKQLNKDFLWIGPKNLSYKINSAEKIRNYPGLSSVSGKEMKEAFIKQINDMGIEILERQVTGVYDLSTHYAILCGQDTYEAKSIILGLGVETIKPVEGEIELLGQGVSYCATCDGFLYKGKEITVVASSKEFEHEAKYLASLASKVNYIGLYKDIDMNLTNVEILKGMPNKITKENKKMKLHLKDSIIESDGIFMLKASISPAVLVPGLEAVEGHIVVDRNMKTNLNGVFACGDCTGRPYQYAKAVGEGNVAAHSVVNYLNILK